MPKRWKREAPEWQPHLQPFRFHGPGCNGAAQPRVNAALHANESALNSSFSLAHTAITQEIVAIHHREIVQEEPIHLVLFSSPTQSYRHPSRLPVICDGKAAPW